jgi:hypothetical protein
MTTLPVILSVAALCAAWTMIRSPARISADPEGLTIGDGNNPQRLSWNEIGCSTVESVGTSGRRRLNITDTKGASIVKLDESFRRFDDLVALVASHVEAKGDDTAMRILRKKARRLAVVLGAMGFVMTLGSIFIAWTTREEQRAARLLKQRGKPGQAEIVRRIVAPDGVTKRVEYRVVGAGGRSGTRNVEVTSAYWNHLEGAKSIPVIFVADEPDISRLATGEVKEPDFTKTPAGGYLMAALVLAVGLFMLGASPFTWNGWDLSIDKNTKKWCLKRDGKIVSSTTERSERIDLNQFLTKG